MVSEIEWESGSLVVEVFCLNIQIVLDFFIGSHYNGIKRLGEIHKGGWEMKGIKIIVHEVLEHPSEKRMREILDTEVIWCCRGRHGALLDIPVKDADEYLQTLEYFYAAVLDNGVWIKHYDDRDTVDMEFTHQAKVSPPPTKPWEWCGKTLVFPEKNL